jgi:hypothetical protein
MDTGIRAALVGALAVAAVLDMFFKAASGLLVAFVVGFILG